MIIVLADVLYVDDKFLIRVTLGARPASPPELVYINIPYSFWDFDQNLDSRSNLPVLLWARRRVLTRV
jgi:hypothetical protein